MQRIFKQQSEYFSPCNIFLSFIKDSFPSTVKCAPKMLKILSALLHMTSFSEVVNFSTALSFYGWTILHFLKISQFSRKIVWNTYTQNNKWEVHNQLDFFRHSFVCFDWKEATRMQNCLKFSFVLSYMRMREIKLFMCSA